MRFGRCLSFALAAAAFSAVGSAQQSTPVSLDVVVTPKHGGAAIAGLIAQDFTVLDNGKPQKITSFSARGGNTAPVEVIFVVDAVDAYYSTVAYERGQIDKFLQANGGKLEYPTQIAIFNDTGTEIQKGFTKDGNAAAKLLDSYTVALHSIRRSTGVYGAGERLKLAMETMHELVGYGAHLPGRKLLVWISPGWPILSSPSITLTNKQQAGIFNEIIGLSDGLRQSQMTVYCIDPLGMNDAGTMRTFYYRSFVKGVKKPNQTQFGDLSLQVLAEQTGGQVLNSSNDLTAQIKKAMADTNAYYSIAFDPAAGEPNEYHKLEIKLAKPGIVARTRTGYYSR